MKGAAVAAGGIGAGRGARARGRRRPALHRRRGGRGPGRGGGRRDRRRRSATAGCAPRRLEEAAGRVRPRSPPGPRPAGAGPAATPIWGTRPRGARSGWRARWPSSAAPLVVQLESGHSIAEGRVPWGLEPAPERHRAGPRGGRRDVRRRRWPTGPAAGRSWWSAGTPTGDRGGPALIERLAAGHPVAVVEMGWPSALAAGRRPGVRHHVRRQPRQRPRGREVLGLAADPAPDRCDRGSGADARRCLSCTSLEHVQVMALR